MEDFAYALEGIILRATELGLGSCWLGGLFGRTAISRALGKADTELIPACSPVGYPAERVGLQDKAIRFGAGSRKRKDPSELFFEDPGDGSWLPLGSEGKLSELLEALRSAHPRRTSSPGGFSSIVRAIACIFFSGKTASITPPWARFDSRTSIWASR